MSKKSKALEFANDLYTIQVTGRHVDVTEAMKNYALEKAKKIERLAERIIDVVITMDIQKLQHRVDIIVKVGTIVIKATDASADMYASVDGAMDKLLNQLRRYHHRIKEHHNKHFHAEDMQVNVLEPTEQEVDFINDDIEEETQKSVENAMNYKIFKTITTPLKTLTQKEAVMKFDLLNDSFMLYRSLEDNKLKVIYRQEDGLFCVMEPEMS